MLYVGVMCTICMTVLLIMCRSYVLDLFFFFNDTATTEIYTLSLHDALPISECDSCLPPERRERLATAHRNSLRSEEHTSELQSPCNLVCRLLLEKKKNAWFNDLRKNMRSTCLPYVSYLVLLCPSPRSFVPLY